MSFLSPIFPDIPRQSVFNSPLPGATASEWIKMFDPPLESPPTPELLIATNPVPEVMRAAGFQNALSAPHRVRRTLFTGRALNAFDGKPINFFLISDADNNATAGGTFPAATVRVPRGAIFQTQAQGAPSPHTIHWHGIEPTALNDGVGHCSFEFGSYLYQWQPNFIGSYFYHCHRNTMMHFEYGLYGFLIIDPPDSYFASCATDPALPGVPALNTIPVGNCRPEPGFPQGIRRTAANTSKFPQFPGFNSNPIDAPDPEANNPALQTWQKFLTDPHAMTIPYDVEALWVFDDRSSEWSDGARLDAFATFPIHGGTPGVDDDFHAHPGNFFAFNQFHSDYWYVTGVNFPGTKRLNVDGTVHIDNAGNPGTGTADVAPNIVIPPALMSGVSGVQVSINAPVDKTILVRCLNGAYNDIIVTFPVDVVIVAWDGRALGVGPFGQYNHSYLVPANTPIPFSVARRFDALIRTSSPVDSFVTAQFVESTVGVDFDKPRPTIFTGRIPFKIGTMPGILKISGTVVDSHSGLPLMGVQLNLSGSASQMVFTDTLGNYMFTGLADGVYTVTASKEGARFFPPTRTVTLSGANQAGQVFRGRMV